MVKFRSAINIGWQKSTGYTTKLELLNQLGSFTVGVVNMKLFYGAVKGGNVTNSSLFSDSPPQVALLSISALGNTRGEEMR